MYEIIAAEAERTNPSYNSYIYRWQPFSDNKKNRLTLLSTLNLNKMRLTYFAFLVILITSSCTKNNEGYVINGYTSNIKDSTMVFLNESNKPAYDSTWIINNQFKFEGKIESDYLNVWVHTKNQYKSIWLVNSKMTFEARDTSFKYARVSGSPIQDQNNEYHELIDSFDVKMDSIESLVEDTPEDSSIMITYYNNYQELEKHQSDASIKFVKMHPDYVLSSFYLTFLQHSISEDITRELYDGLSEKVKRNEWGEIVLNHIKNSIKLELGMQAPEITLPDIKGELISLSSFRGKYVLLDFWSSSCGPCRLENQNLVKAYTNYKNNDFEIFSVSLDVDQNKWKSAIEKDLMSWINLSDLKGSNGEYPILYDVSAIPTNYLLDKNGIIIDKYIRGVDLQEKLDSLFSK